MANGDTKFRKASYTPKQAKVLEEGLKKSYPEPSDNIKNILSFRDTQRRLRKHYTEQFPEFAELEASAPADHAERVKYAESLAKDPKYSKMFIPDDKLSGYFDDTKEFEDYKGKRDKFPEYMSGDFDVEGGGPQSSAYGLRSALLEPEAEFIYEDKGKSKARFVYDTDEDGGFTNELKSLEVNELDPYLDKNYPKLRDGVSLETMDSKGLTSAAQYSEMINTKPELNNEQQGPSDAQNAVSKIGPWGAIIGAASKVGTGIGDSMGGKEGSVVSTVFDPMRAAKNKNMSASQRIFGTLNPVAGGIWAHKADEKAKKDALRDQVAMESASKLAPTVNTQAEVYEDGTQAGAETKPVEVEKDELVLRKNALDKFFVVADFTGGKTHEQGGEDYEMQEGDIVFPGKKKATIEKHLAAGNHAGIESERMKLPKDLPGDGEMRKGCSPKLANGYDGDDINKWEKYIADAVKSGEFTTEEGERALKDVKEGLEYSSNPDNSPKTSETWQESTGYKPMSFDDVWTTAANVEDQVVAQKEQQAEKQIAEPNVIPAASKTSTPEAASKEAEIINPMESFGIDRFKAADVDTGSLRGVEETPDEVKSQSQAIVQGGGDLSNVLDYVPAAVNILKGALTTPEKVDRRFVNPETVQYQDSSDALREQSGLQERIDLENASRFSGGSAQVARASKAAAGSEGTRRLAAIDTAETQRADQIEAGNVGIRNQAQAQNVNLANQYDSMDAQNKAAIDAYFDQGVHDFGRIATQRRRDAGMRKSQDVAIKMLETDRFKYADEAVKFKK